MIRLERVTKMYKTSTRPALDRVSVEVGKGEFVFLIGPSGSGKSTFLRLLLREDVPTRGKIWVTDLDVAKLPRRKVPRLRQRIGVVFQDFRLLTNKTVGENVAFALEVIGKSPSRTRSTSVASRCTRPRTAERTRYSASPPISRRRVLSCSSSS